MPVTAIRRHGVRALVILPLLLLLLFPSVSVRGASEGLLLWFHVVLPTLLPFLICTRMIASLDGIRFLLAPVYPAIRRIFGFQPEGAYALLCGLVCGYPVGASLCAMFHGQGTLSDEEAHTLLAVCNHPSPMFLLGYVSEQLPVSVSPAILLLAVYLPVFPLYAIAAACYRFHGKTNRSSAQSDMVSAHPADGRNRLEANPNSADSNRLRPNEIILSSFETMILIGGYLMLFTILSAWVSAVPALPSMARALLAAVFEMTSGIHALCLALPPQTAIPLSLAAASFGGLSGLLQTKSVLSEHVSSGQIPKKAGSLTIRHRFGDPSSPLGNDYIIWKLLHACLSGLTAAALLQVSLPALPR
ncbi:MAG: hypothetical protein LUE86_07635 [Clostridiales bacterium]|nr:hypothetical protein [Clostridiales bacterium]